MPMRPIVNGALCGRSRSSSTLSENKDLVGAMFRKAAREGLVRAGRVACDLFADCATSDADDIMINSTSDGKMLWSTVQNLLADHHDELKAAATEIVPRRGDASPILTTTVHKMLHALVRQMLCNPAKVGARGVTLIAFHSVLVEVMCRSLYMIVETRFAISHTL